MSGTDQRRPKPVAFTSAPAEWVERSSLAAEEGDAKPSRRPLPAEALDARVVQPPSQLDEEDAPHPDGAARGYIHSSEVVGSVNGPGIRYTLYLSGCPLRCLYCHNPDTWEMRLGEHVTAETVLEDIGKYARFISISGGGVTTSGGEPLLQPRFLLALYRGIKDRFGLHIALDTSGFLGTRASDELLDLTDLVLLDVKSGIPDVYERVTSAPLEPTLAFARRLADRGNAMWVRYVLVPGLTDDPANVAAVADHLMALGPGAVQRVEVLPYHEFGIQKYEALGRQYPLAGVQPPSAEVLGRTRQIFRSRELTVF
jgi:pyruvate formate lyase activating enzyme